MLSIEFKGESVHLAMTCKKEGSSKLNVHMKLQYDKQGQGFQLKTLEKKWEHTRYPNVIAKMEEIGEVLAKEMLMPLINKELNVMFGDLKVIGDLGHILDRVNLQKMHINSAGNLIISFSK